MVTWYTCPGGRAFSVRPDLWPAGLAVTVSRGRTRRALADWAMNGRTLRPMPGSSRPGVAEALVLEGVTLERYSRTWEDWTPDP